MSALAEGWWCRDCEFFEEGDMEAGGCMSCGCSPARHVEVQVVES